MLDLLVEKVFENFGVGQSTEISEMFPRFENLLVISIPKSSNQRNKTISMRQKIIMEQNHIASRVNR